MKKVVVFFFIVLISSLKGDEISKMKMRELIKQIKNQSSDKILVTQNGTNIFFNENQLDETFLKNVDGVSQESLFYGVGGVNVATPLEEQKYLLKNLLELEKNNKVVFSVNYANERKLRDIILKDTKKYNFIGEAIPNYSANSIFQPLQKENSKDVKSLKDVKNFLYLLNPEKFKTLSDYYRILKNTDFDLLIIEPSLNGEFLSKEQIENLKIRKNGTKRLVISYFSIGEAENYREYWNKSWEKKMPSWIVKENENWPGNYIIKYWDLDWKNIIKDYQKKLDSIGVDGYYLDTIDTYEQF
ncbi:endo alpha-1,4 polygalactosaminidase [Candidatus Cetobacterium colombiensis]|uniref:Endo alpha-1,4 polygalactosaminidase n=1 Tax=Candidatus Cetobacterium colombiensis TaxID=3073100 RepID=A0ABU4W5Z5_9FUSO|nr:endo alpha-1,4 polygalactosaminidase [Candidatus Cetobacterium colombiensis]MDX8334948.1 endo alpha-1,4 polygalactosaminidase [Candidatus Cetobacterium colombiensis]